jgi:hypothetical protein
MDDTTLFRIVVKLLKNNKFLCGQTISLGHVNGIVKFMPIKNYFYFFNNTYLM